jgi:hypothetical protein
MVGHGAKEQRSSGCAGRASRGDLLNSKEDEKQSWIGYRWGSCSTDRLCARRGCGRWWPGRSGSTAGGRAFGASGQRGAGGRGEGDPVLVTEKVLTTTKISQLVCEVEEISDENLATCVRGGRDRCDSLPEIDGAGVRVEVGEVSGDLHDRQLWPWVGDPLVGYARGRKEEACALRSNDVCVRLEAVCRNHWASHNQGEHTGGHGLVPRRCVLLMRAVVLHAQGDSISRNQVVCICPYQSHRTCDWPNHNSK